MLAGAIYISIQAGLYMLTNKKTQTLHFEYEETSYIPKIATLPDGKKYTGAAFGTCDIADWSGNFVNGLPDGDFNVCLADRMSIVISYRAGVCLES